MPLDFIHAFFPDEPESPKENSETSVSSVSDEQQLSPEQLAEAERIARELVKLRDAGAIKDANDPEARFYASLLHYVWRGIYRQARPQKPQNQSTRKVI